MSCRLQIAFGHYSDGARCRDHIRKRRSPLSTSPYNYCTFKQIHNSTACRDVEWDNVEDHVAFFFFVWIFWCLVMKMFKNKSPRKGLVLGSPFAPGIVSVYNASTERAKKKPDQWWMYNVYFSSHSHHRLQCQPKLNEKKRQKKNIIKNIQKYRYCEYCMSLCEGVCMCVLYVPVIYAKLFIFAVCFVLYLFVVRVCVGFSFKNIIFKHSSFLSLSFFAQIQTHIQITTHTHVPMLCYLFIHVFPSLYI